MSLALDGLRIARGPRTLLALTLRVAPGEIVTVMGPSGAGKSTLLSAIAGAAPAAFRVEGRVILDDVDVSRLPTEARRIGLLFQDDLLFPHLSVGGNLAFALPQAIRGRAARRARIEAALAEAGLAGFADRDPATLSGGERARAALMRALVAEPRALLLDEPFSKLDAALRATFRAFVFGAVVERGLPALLVTHDPDDAPPGGRVVRVG